MLNIALDYDASRRKKTN